MGGVERPGDPEGVPAGLRIVRAHRRKAALGRRGGERGVARAGFRVALLRRAAAPRVGADRDQPAPDPAGAGAVAAAAVLLLIASGKPGYSLAVNGLAANGYGEHSPGGYSLLAGFVVETVLTFFFLLIILGSTEKRAPQGFGPLAIGFALTLIHLISIPVTNTSVNPARSLGPAVFVGGWALTQLWLFWVAPLLGAVLAGLLYPLLARGTETYADADE